MKLPRPSWKRPVISRDNARVSLYDTLAAPGQPVWFRGETYNGSEMLFATSVAHS